MIRPFLKKPNLDVEYEKINIPHLSKEYKQVWALFKFYLNVEIYIILSSSLLLKEKLLSHG